MASYYISPLGSGSKDGSSAADAAAIAQLPGVVQKVGAGGSILLLADQGLYSVSGPLILNAGGTAAAPITIRGVDGRGDAMDAQFVGTRALNWSSGAADGQDAFRLMGGADNLVFENLAFRNVSNAIRVGADISNLSVNHASAQNVAHFLEDYVSGPNRSATISGLVVDDVTVSGYAKSAVRLQYDTHDVVIRNTFGDSKGIDGEFAIGVHLHGTVHDVLLSHVTMQNNLYTGTPYWNGDGFATEGDVYDVLFDHTVARGSADAGYDIKSAKTVLDGVSAEGNNRNYRFWNDDTILTNATGVDPHHAGGTASQSQVWLGEDAVVRITDSRFTDASAATTVFSLEQSHATLTLENVAVGKSAAAALSKQYGGSAIKGTPIVEASSHDTTPPPSPIFTLAGQFQAGILETTAVGTVIGTLKAEAGAILTLAAGSPFALDPSDTNLGDGQDVKLVSPLDYEKSSTASFSATAHDAAGHRSVVLTVSRAVGDVAEVPPGTTTGTGANDRLTGGASGDTIYGRGGSDALHGYGGADKLYGGDGRDLIYGGGGNDRIEGGAGDDWLYGQTGADTFVFGGADVGVDTIADFARGQDRIDLSGIDANPGKGGDQSFTFLGTGAFTGVAGQLHIAHSASSHTTSVLGDTDGDGNADVVIKLLGMLPLSQGDFIL